MITKMTTAQVAFDLGGPVEALVGSEREFKTGSRGYFVSGKVNGTDGKRYQVSCNIVEIGSKPKDGE